MRVEEDKMRGGHKTGQVCQVVARVKPDAKTSSLAAFVLLLAVPNAADGGEIVLAEGCIVVGQKSRSCVVHTVMSCQSFTRSEILGSASLPPAMAVGCLSRL